MPEYFPACKEVSSLPAKRVWPHVRLVHKELCSVTDGRGKTFGLIAFSTLCACLWLAVVPRCFFLQDPTDVHVAEAVLEQMRAEPRVSKAPAAGRGLSQRPWLSRVMERYGRPPRQHPQQYGAPRARQLAGAVLNGGNTEPIRFHLNFDTLYEDKVQTNPILADRFCFRLKDWFKAGHPNGPKPSTADDAVDGCNRATMGMELRDLNTWCRCTQGDVITEDMRRLVILAVTQAVAELKTMVRVRPVKGKLKLKQSEGVYTAMWQKLNQTGVYCNADCVKGSLVSVPDSLCSEGVDADIILSTALPPPVPGVQGSGGFCAQDQNGRPVHITFDCMRRVDQSQSKENLDELARGYRTLVLHEVLHGLGFGMGLWGNTFNADGSRRVIVKQLKVTDADGTQDFVYHFVKGTRTYDAAQLYFGCHEDSKWQGLPLMSWPPSGRDSHHETRVMRDDLMSYGYGTAVSGITLASLEDTGHYLANYSHAQCMNWGRGRGCEFVMSRCQVRPTGSVVTGLTVPTYCNRAWTTALHASNDQALQKCTPIQCQSRLDNGKATCDLECFTGTLPADSEEAPCQQGPVGDVAAAGSAGWLQDLQDSFLKYDGSVEQLQSLAFVAIVPLTLLVFGVFCKRCLCPTRRIKRSKRVFWGLCAPVLLAGFGLTGVASYGLLNFQMFEAYISLTAILYLQMAGLATVFLTGFGIYAVYYGHRCKILVYLFIGVIWLCFTVAACVMLATFAGNLDQLSRSSLAQTSADRESLWARKDEGIGVQDVYAQMESFTCRTYQLCCEPAEMFNLRAANGAARQCKEYHEGSVEDIASILADPSHSEFCPTISGMDAQLSAAKGICRLVEFMSEGGFSLSTCRGDYCASGLEGYEDFLSVVVIIYRKNMRIAGVVASALIVLQVVMLVNLYYIRRQSQSLNQIGLEDIGEVSATKDEDRPRTSVRGTQTQKVMVRRSQGSDASGSQSRTQSTGPQQQQQQQRQQQVEAQLRAVIPSYSAAAESKGSRPSVVVQASARGSVSAARSSAASSSTERPRQVVTK